jgi:psiF repeat
MLRLVSLVVVATWLSSGAGMAQTAPLQPVPAAPAASGEAVKLARATCRSDAETKGLAGKVRREAVRDCMRGKFPDSETSRRVASGQTRDGRPTARTAREACKSDVEGKGLKGAERKAAMATCFKEKRPDLAARADCRKEAKAKGLDGDALKSAVKACAKT